jgi:hypothetical protein
MLKQIVGNTLLTAAIPVSIAIASWLHSDISSIHTAINANANMTGQILQRVDDLTTAVREHNTTTDAAINELRVDDKARTAAIATAEAELEDLRREPPRVEPWQRFTPVPQPLPAIGNALSHIFPHHQWHRHP